MLSKIYLAGASKEIERIRPWASRLTEAGFHVMSTWIDVIDAVGAPNSTDATIHQLTKWTLRDLAEVKDSDVLWLFLPARGVETVGAYIELGTAFAHQRFIAMSGPDHRPIFTPVMCDAHSVEDQAMFDYLCKRYTESQRKFIKSWVDRP